jgi:mannose-1-phosphate guanylyltransferase/phosphomannomutase
LIRQIRHAGIHEIAINLHYQGQQIRHWLGHGAALGVEVIYSEEDELLGSAGGVRRMRQFFGDQPALIVHGDILFDVDLSDLIQYHQSHAAQATLMLHPAHHRYDYGKIRVNDQGQIAQFVDHRAPGVSEPLIETVFTGVQVLDPAALDTIPADGAAALTTDVYPGLLTSAPRLYGYLTQGYWSDIGTPRRYWQTNMDVVGGRLGGVYRCLDQDELSRTPQPQGSMAGAISAALVCPPGLEIPPGSCVGPGVILGEGCVLANDVRLVHSVLWPRVRVGQGATIEGTIVMNDLTIADGSHLVGKIVSARGIVDL